MKSVAIRKPTGCFKTSLDNRVSSINKNISNNIQFYKKRILTVLLIYGFLMLGFFVFTGFCSYTEGKFLVKLIQSWIIDIFGGNVIDDVKNLTYVEFNSSTNAFVVGGISINTLGGLISSVYGIFKNLGYMLLIVFFLIGLMEDISFNQVYVEKMVKKFIFFCIGIALISKSMDLVYFIANIGSALVNKVSVVAVQNMPNYDALCQEVYDNCTTAANTTGTFKKMSANIADFTSAVGYILQLFIPWLVSKASYIAVQFVCWSRFFELLIMGIMSPLSFADISRGGGGGSTAMKAVKNIMALSLSGAAILIICIICNQIQGSLIATADFGTAIWNCVLISAVQMGLVQKANDLVKQILGMA